MSLTLDPDGPMAPPPKGVEPNFDNPSNKTAMAYGLISLCSAFAVLAMVLRCYAKIFKVRKFHVEDALALLAIGPYAGFLYCSIWRIHFVGAFVHTWDIRLRNLSPILFNTNAGTTLYAAFMLVLKPAIVLEWVRIFVPQGTRNFFFWTAHAVMVINVLLFFSCIVATNLSCIPHRAIWDKTIPAKCINPRDIELVAGIINAVIDVILLLLPHKVIWSLNMTRQRKMGVSLVFMVGILACIAACFRVASGIQWSATMQRDPMYAASSVSLWALAEMTCAYLIFSMPALPKAFSGKGLVSVLATSLKSWTAKRSLIRSQASWTGQNTTLNAGSTYREINESGTRLEPVAPAASVPVTASGKRSDGIHCTTNFTAEVEYDRSQESLQAKRQHPW